MTRRKRYSAEFKREALRRANEEGVTDTLVAEELGFSTRQLQIWRASRKFTMMLAWLAPGARRISIPMSLSSSFSCPNKDAC
jgi:hypothetical protein